MCFSLSKHHIIIIISIFNLCSDPLIYQKVSTLLRLDQFKRKHSVYYTAWRRHLCIHCKAFHIQLWEITKEHMAAAEKCMQKHNNVNVLNLTTKCWSLCRCQNLHTLMVLQIQGTPQLWKKNLKPSKLVAIYVCVQTSFKQSYSESCHLLFQIFQCH